MKGYQRNRENQNNIFDSQCILYLRTFGKDTISQQTINKRQQNVKVVEL